MLCRNCGASEYDHQHILTDIYCPKPILQGDTYIFTQYAPAGGLGDSMATKEWFDGERLDGLASFMPKDKKAYVEFPPKEKPWASNPKFAAALKKMAAVHDLKSADYAQANDRFSNFRDAAATAGVSIDDVFAVLIGTKLARLKELTKNDKIPNNESIQDTRLDLAVYSTLWLAFHENE